MPYEEHPDFARRLRELVRSLKDRWYIVAVCALLTTAVALAWSLTREDQFESTSRLLIQQDEFESSVAGLDRKVQIDPERQTATDLELVEQPVLAARVVRELDLPFSPAEVADKVTAESEGNSRVLAITVRDTDPERAADIATAYAEEYVGFRARTERARYERALRSITDRLAEAREADEPSTTIRQLRSQEDQVSLLLSLQSGGAEVIQDGEVNEARVAPKPARDAVIALLFGLILGGLLAYGRERVDPRLREEREVCELLPGVPLIALIPDGPVDASGRPLEADSFRGLHSTLSVLDADRSLRTLLVTSATMGEGKSTTSLNLALAMAEREESVLLIEADLRRRGLSERLGLERRAGLSEVLSEDGPVSDELVEVSLDESLARERPSRSGGVAAPALAGVVRVLPAGRVPRNPHALLSPAKLERVLVEASAISDKVVIDGTPLGLVKDMLPLAGRVDAVVLVVRLHHTRRRELKRLRDLLTSARIQPFGLVVFGVQPDAAYDNYLRR